MTRPASPSPIARFRVTIQHGEACTVYNVVDTAQPQDEQPAVVASFASDADDLGAPARWLAQDYCDRHNAKEVPHA